MMGHEMAAADLAEFSVGVFGLVKGADVGFAFGDPHIVRLPQAEGVDRRRRPRLAVAAMTVAGEYRRARNLDLDRTTKTAGLVSGGTRFRRFALRQKVVVCGMLGHEVSDEIAFDREFAPQRPHRVERRASELGADAAST